MIPVKPVEQATGAAAEPKTGSLLTGTSLRITGPALGVSLAACVISFAWSWHPSLWTDEAATISAARRSTHQLWALVHTIDAVHGFYYLCMHFWISIAGASALAVRFPSAVAVGVTAGLLVVLTRRLGAKPGTSMLAGLVFSLLPRTTWLGLEARSYAGTALIAVLLTLILLAALTSGRWWIGYAVLAALGIALNLYLALLLVAHGVTLLLLKTRRRSIAGFAVAGIAGVALASPVLLGASSQSSQLGEQNLGPVQVLRFLVINQAFLGDTPTASTAPSLSLSVSNLSDLWELSAVLLALVAVIVILTSVMYAVRITDSVECRLLAWAAPWAVLPGVLVGGYALTGSPLYSARYFSFCTPAVAIMIAMGLVPLSRRSAGAATATGLVMVLLAAPIYISQRQVTAKGGTDWSEAAEYVGSHKANRQAVYFAPRYPTLSGVTVGRTLRTVRDAYPRDFTGLRDVTLLRPATLTNDLIGTSARLQASAARLKGMTAVWVIRRNDYPAELSRQETNFLVAHDFRVTVRTWLGPMTSVTEFSRVQSRGSRDTFTSNS